MPTLSQIAKSVRVWGYIRPGAKLFIEPRRGAIRTPGRFFTVEDDHTVSPGEVFRRNFRVYPRFPSWTDDREDVWLSYYDGDTLYYVYPTDVEVIDMPSVPKSFRSQATKGSVWRFVRDWEFNGYDTTHAYHTIPAGTEFTVASNKTSMVYFGNSLTLGVDEKGLPIEKNDAIDPFFRYDVWNKCHFIPLREIVPYIELVSDGAVRVYWTIENNDGRRLVSKRYNNLGNVKASLRVRGGLVNTDPDHDVDRWFDQDNEWGTEAFPIDNGVWAVQYDHATDTELSREDMLEYMTIAKLSS